MRIDIHSHLMSVAFPEHLRGRDTLPTAVRDAGGYIAHCAPGLSLPYRAPILSVEAKLADMDTAGIDLAVLSHGLPEPTTLGGAQGRPLGGPNQRRARRHHRRPPRPLRRLGQPRFGDTARTIAEADRCLDQLGLADFQVWSSFGS